MKKCYPFLPKNWLNFGLITVFAAFLNFGAWAQNGPAIQWNKAFGGSSTDYFRIMQQTSDGGYIAGGYSSSGISGNKSQDSKGIEDYWIVKLDANGNKQWDKTFGGASYDHLYALKQTSDGGYILGGRSGSGISGDKTQVCQGGSDYWVVKLDASGNKLWDKTFGGSDQEYLYCLQQTSDGGYVLGGYSTSGISGDKTQASKGSTDYWIVKLDAFGNKQWDKTFGGADGESCNSLQQTTDGGYILGGSSSSGISGDKTQASKGGHDYWLIKLDSLGNKLWDKAFGGSKIEHLYSLQELPNMGFILGGISESGIGGDKSQPSKGQLGYDFWVVKVDVNGNKLWDRTFGGSDDDVLFSVQQTKDGGYVLGGHSSTGANGDKTSASNGGYDYWLVKIDNSGNKLWDKSIGGSSFDVLYSMQQTTDGGYILGGYSNSGINGDKSQASFGDKDFWIVKLAADITGLKEPETSFNVSISPNPNQGKFTLQLSNLTASKAEVTVSDLLGRVVLQQPLTVSNRQISEELTLPYAKGMYLLQVKFGEQLITRKIVVE